MAPSRKGKEKLNEDDVPEEPVIQEARVTRSSLLLLPEIVEGKISMDGAGLPRLPPIGNVLRIIGKCSVPFEKKLTKTDFHSLGRLILHKEDVKKALLPLLNKRETRNLSSGIQVETFDHMGDSYPMIFIKYHNTYQLYKGWKNYLNDYKLKENEEYYVTVWMFRREDQNGKLCFAVILKGV